MRFAWIILTFLTLGTTGCFNPFDFSCPSFICGNGDDNSDNRNVDNTFPLALGGSPPGWNRIEVTDDYDQLRFESDAPEVVQFAVPAGSSSFESAGAAILEPQQAGIANATIENVQGSESSVLREFTVWVPPQKLIQVLMGEARGQMAREATIDGDGQVQLGSISATAEAITAVIQNRVNIINDTQAPGLFVVDGESFDANPPSSEYDAVIEANLDGIYQFSPVDPNDINNEVYLDSADRDDLIDDSERIAYDQALMSAAFIFSEAVGDPTEGAFGFYSPTEFQYQQLEEALLSETTELPEDAGMSDDDFPAFAPIQILILSAVTTATPGSDIPGFVFVRERASSDPAVVAK